MPSAAVSQLPARRPLPALRPRSDGGLEAAVPRADRARSGPSGERRPLVGPIVFLRDALGAYRLAAGLEAEPARSLDVLA